jgi:hypothetical protein
MLVCVGLVVWWGSHRTRNHEPQNQLPIILLLTLAPTAPFLSPPDSRYMYLPVIFAGILLGLAVQPWLQNSQLPTRRYPTNGISGTTIAHALSLVLVVAAAWWAMGELSYREWKFSAGTGSGGSLWHLANKVCNDAPLLQRVILVDPPIAAPHAEAIIKLACRDAGPRTLIVSRDGIEQALREGSVVIAFPGGSAAVERWN